MQEVELLYENPHPLSTRLPTDFTLTLFPKPWAEPFPLHSPIVKPDGFCCRPLGECATQHSADAHVDQAPEQQGRGTRLDASSAQALTHEGSDGTELLS